MMPSAASSIHSDEDLRTRLEGGGGADRGSRCFKTASLSSRSTPVLMKLDLVHRVDRQS